MASSTAQLAVAAAGHDRPAESRPDRILPTTVSVAGLGRRLCRTGAWTALVVVTLQTAIYLPDTLFASHEPHLLDADGDFSVWAWASASAIFVGALASLVLSLIVERRRVGVHACLAAILAFLSLDETVGIHERITNELPSLLGLADHYSRLIWPALYLPLLATLAILLIFASRSFAARSARLVRVGLLLLVTAVVAELASTVLVAYGQTGRDVAYAVEVAVEEGCELGGWILIATALLARMISELLTLGRGSPWHDPVESTRR